LRSNLGRAEDEIRRLRTDYSRLQEASKESIGKDEAQQLRSRVSDLQSQLSFKESEMQMRVATPGSAARTQSRASRCGGSSAVDAFAPRYSTASSPKRVRIQAPPPVTGGTTTDRVATATPAAPGGALPGSAVPPPATSAMGYVPRHSGPEILRQLFLGLRVAGGPATAADLSVLAAFLGVSGRGEMVFIEKLSSLLDKGDNADILVGAVRRSLDAVLSSTEAVPTGHRINTLRVLTVLVNVSPRARKYILEEAMRMSSPTLRRPDPSATIAGLGAHPFFNNSRILCRNAESIAVAGAAAEMAVEADDTSQAIEPGRSDPLLQVLAAIGSRPDPVLAPVDDPAVLAIRIIQTVAEAAESTHFPSFAEPFSTLDVVAWLGSARISLAHAEVFLDLLTALVRMPFAAPPMLKYQDGFTLVLEQLQASASSGRAGHARLRTRVIQLLSTVLCNARGSDAYGTSVHSELLIAVAAVVDEELDELDGGVPESHESPGELDGLKASVNLILLIMLRNGFGPSDDARHVQPNDPLAAVLLRMEDFLERGTTRGVKERFEDEKAEIITLLNAFFGEKSRGSRASGAQSDDMQPT